MRRAALLVLMAAACAPPPAAPRRVAVPREPPTVLYPADLGTDSLDVSHYPPRIRRGYAAFASACSSCHGLSRTLDAPRSGPRYWELYLVALRRTQTEPLSAEQRRAVLEFLDYDEKARKSGPLWEARVADLQRRYDALLTARERGRAAGLSAD